MKNYHKNPRQIKDKQFSNLRAWLLELGDLSGIVHDLNADEVISGNQRMRAIDIAKCEIVLTEGPHEPDAQGTVAHGYVIWQGAKYNYRQVRWTPEQCEKANIVANKAGGTWDFDILANEWEKDDLLEWGFELEELGMFPDDDKPDDPGAQIDKAEELREKWGVVAGQMWVMGEHRLIVGDCTDAAVVTRVMGGEKAAMVFSDPPYNCASENGIYGADVSKAMAGLKAAEWDQDFDLQPALDVLPLAKDVTVYLCSSHHLAPVIWAWMKTWADHFSWCVWSKPNPMPSLAKRHWTWNAELVPYATRGKHVFNFPANGHALCVWTIDKSKETDHPTEKPVAVPEHAIAHSSKAGDLVFDGFLGSGTTLIACERLGRRCRAIEISPAYCAVTIERGAVMTGGTPELVEPAV